MSDVKSKKNQCALQYYNVQFLNNVIVKRKPTFNKFITFITIYDVTKKNL